MTEPGKSRRRELEAPLVARAWQDDAFRQQLLSDPRAAIQQELGVALPPELDLQVVEETPTRLYLRLPANCTQLSDDQLNAAAGGICCGDY